jgi:hypothetical protein
MVGTFIWRDIAAMGHYQAGPKVTAKSARRRWRDQCHKRVDCGRTLRQRDHSIVFRLRALGTDRDRMDITVRTRTRTVSPKLTPRRVAGKGLEVPEAPRRGATPGARCARSRDRAGTRRSKTASTLLAALFPTPPTCTKLRVGGRLALAVRIPAVGWRPTLAMKRPWTIEWHTFPGDR